MIKKPMLAGAIKTLDHIEHVETMLPLLASHKIDGIRCLLHPHLGPCTRTFKPIPNDYIRDSLDMHASGLDGELVTYNEDGTIRTFNQIQGDVMRKAGEPTFKFLVFDCFNNPENPFTERFAEAIERTAQSATWTDTLEIVPHINVHTMERFHELHARHQAAGWEGTMLRHPDGLYKQGRSTIKQSWLVKVKEFSDAEGTIIGFEERMHNANPDKKDATGHTNRASCKENMVPMDTLGALVLSTEFGELKVGSGFSDDLRADIWEHRDYYMGDIVTFTYQASGALVLPRFPTFKGFRPEFDYMSTVDLILEDDLEEDNLELNTKRCDDCGGLMEWCDICDMWNKICCEEYGTCMCS